MKPLLILSILALLATAPAGLSALPSDEPRACVAAGVCADVPLLVDEEGDTMTGDLAFASGRGVAFPGGLLSGSPSLRFGASAVCVAGVAAAGCGDITAVTAGTGLTGGGASGDVGLAVNPAAVQTRVASACAAGQSIRVIAQDGTVTCETDDGQVYTGAAPITVGGTTIGLSTTGCIAGEAWRWSGAAWGCEPQVTSVGSGAGLTGGPITGSGTLSIATGGVTSAMVQDGAVGSADVNSGQVQLRVTGQCLARDVVQVIRADGTVGCREDAFPRFAATAFSVNNGTLPFVCQTRGSVTLSVPAAGPVLVDADLLAVIGHLNGLTDELQIHLTTTGLNVCDAPYAETTRVIVSSNLGPGTFHENVHASRVFGLLPGSYTFYVNARMVSGTGADDLLQSGNVRAMWLPTT